MKKKNTKAYCLSIRQNKWLANITIIININNINETYVKTHEKQFACIYFN